MKQLSYKMLVTVQADETQEPETFLQEKSIICSDENLEESLAMARAESYNGEVSVEDAPSTPDSYIPTPEQSAVLMMRSVFAEQSADMDDDTIIRYSGLADEWQPGDHKNGDIYNADSQTWECYQPYNNDVYPDVKPGNPAWFTFNRPLHGKSPETARPFVPVQGSHDMYRAGEYAVFTDGKKYRCKSDTAYSPADYPDAWEVYRQE